jgi:hypothetical protein
MTERVPFLKIKLILCWIIGYLGLVAGSFPNEQILPLGAVAALLCSHGMGAAKEWGANFTSESKQM